MARLTLQTKKPKQKINRVTSDPGWIPANDPSMFELLTDNRCENEKFSRVDRWMVNHYYLIGTEWLVEKIFYPSYYGFEQIEKEQYTNLIKMRDRLIKEGIGLHGERPIPQINKPTKRLELKCKPNRMALSCKE